MTPGTLVQLLMQIAAPLPYVGVGLAAFAIARRVEGVGLGASAWLVTGLAFLLSGSGHLLQALWAAVAVAWGPDSAVFAAYIRWTPAQNHSRALMMLVFGVVLTLLPRLASGRRAAGWGRRSLALLGCGLAAGAALGAAEGPFEAGRHFPLLALLDTIQLLVLVFALVVNLAGDRLDRHLWAMIAVYAVAHATDVIWLSALSWLGTPGVWTPNLVYLQVFLLAGGVATLLVALRRLQLARRNVPVAGPLESLDSASVRTIG